MDQRALVERAGRGDQDAFGLLVDASLARLDSAARLTMHACIDVARHRRRRVIEVELDPLDDMPVADSSALTADRDFLDRALRRLEPEQRAIIVLRSYLELSLLETSDALGIPLGTTKSRLHRALAQMRINVTLEDEETSAPVTQGRFA